MPIYVKVGKLGSPATEYALANGANAGQALSAAGITLAQGWVIARNGSFLKKSDKVRDGDRITVMPHPKGGC